MAKVSKGGILFIVLLGIVSLFADITYEGARSVTGPYLAILGANAATVGTIAGLGELVSYGMRIFSGFITDKTQKYWLIVFIGYLINLIAIPLLAFAATWQWAAVLILLERFGKAIRNPSRDTLISFASKETGRGWGFGLHNALDQIGAILGPFCISAALFYQFTYQECFAFLAIPALLALMMLGISYFLYPNPHQFEQEEDSKKTESNFSFIFWIYLFGVMCVAAGYLDFSLIAFHFQKKAILSPIWIPIVYGIAMGVQGASSLVLGRIFDYFGVRVLNYATIISSFSILFIFNQEWSSILFGMILWGIGLGTQGTLMRAIVVMLVPIRLRASAYGILNFGFGVSWFLGSALMGFLYDYSPSYLIVFSVISQLASIPFFAYLISRTNRL